MRKRALAAAAAMLMLAAVVATLLMLSTTAQPIEQDEAVAEKLTQTYVTYMPEPVIRQEEPERDMSAWTETAAYIAKANSANQTIIAHAAWQAKTPAVKTRSKSSLARASMRERGVSAATKEPKGLLRIVLLRFATSLQGIGKRLCQHGIFGCFYPRAFKQLKMATHLRSIALP